MTDQTFGKYYVGDNYGSESNPIRQSHLNSYALCGRNFYVKYILGNEEELRRVNTEIGILDHEAFESYHCKKYISPEHKIDWVVKDLVTAKFGDQDSDDILIRAKKVFAEDLEERLCDDKKAPIKQIQQDKEKTVDKAVEHGWEMLKNYIFYNAEDIILVIDDTPMCEVDFKLNYAGLWFEGTIDQIRISQETKDKYGNRFDRDGFFHLLKEGEMKLEIADTKTGIMIPGYFGSKNSIQLRLYALGMKYGSFIIGGVPIVLGALPDKAYIYHTRKLETYKKKYTHPTKKNPDGTKKVFQKGDFKGDPVVMMYSTKEEMENALKKFPETLRSIFDGIQKEVWTPNAMACDGYCSIQNACIGEAESFIDKEMLDEAIEIGKQLGI